MDEYKDWLELGSFHSYVETEPLLAPRQFPTEPPKQPKKPRKKREYSKDASKTPVSKWREAITFCTPMLIALCVAGVLRGFVFTNTRVPTPSMEHTIMSGSRLVGSKLSYLSSEPQRYDVVIFKFPDDETQDYVKRIIGLPGEKIEIKNGQVYVNDSTVPLRDDFVTACVPTGNYGPYYVPNDSYFMLGDNRGNSADSRFWTHTYVKREKIIAKVQFEYYPEWKKIE